MKPLLIGFFSITILATPLHAGQPERADWKETVRDLQKFRDSMEPAKKAMDAQAKVDSYKHDKDEHDRTIGLANKSGADLKGKVKQATDLGSAAKEALDAYKALTKEDATMSPDYSPADMPHIPSKCAESEECGTCYESAYANLKKARISLERLRAVGAATKNMYDKGIAFGDGVSSVHGLAAAGWQLEKLKVEKSLKETFNPAYDSKHIELIGKLKASLQKIGECEEKHFKEEGWYERFGFIYYTFMSDRYKRSW
ncbi:MAG TPA: hypothetical protein VNM92_00460 [Thermoanaerobaculia bacterium]|nr:hypothetical protein [Thermoanaerobaculia bacterium]